MIPLIKSYFAQSGFRQLFFSVLAAAGLFFLFVMAQPVDPAVHNRLTRDLRELQTRDTELGEAVMQHNYLLLHNYDGVVNIMRRMQSLAAGLDAHLLQGALPDTPEIRHEVQALQLRIEQKAEVLEQFKSDNAVLKNSFTYLPRMVNAVREKIPASTGLSEVFELLLRDTLLMAVDQSAGARAKLEQRITQMQSLMPAMPQQVKGSAFLALRHAELIMQYENRKKNMLFELSSKGAHNVGIGLEQLYLDYYQAQQLTASRYRLLLLLSAMLMLGYAVYAFYRMKQEKQRLRVAATAFDTQEGIMILDGDKRIVRVNPAFSNITGYSAEEAVGQTPDLLKSELQDAEFFHLKWDALARDHYWQGELWNRHKDGKSFPVWLTTTAVTDVKGRVTNYVSVFSDITQRKEAEEQIRQLAFYDPLTRLPNRRLLIDRLRHTMASGSRSMDHGAILFVDLDNFKTLNDTKGHDVGDLLLNEASRRLQDCVRGGDTVARFGGDEFIVMLEGLGAEAGMAAAQARAVGEKIRDSLSQPYPLKDFEHHSSCSIGICLFRAHEISVDDLLKRADTAMYEAKAAGRNTLRFFDPAMQFTLETRTMLEADLRRALAHKQLKLFYEAQTDGNNRIIGVEMLLRWIHPVRGLVLPGEFIPLAEQTGLILPIGLWVLETACTQIKAWETNPLACDLQIAVNVSARQFHQHEFVEQVRNALDAAGADPTRLRIELTESVVLDNVNQAVAKMNELKSIGVRFSMDDFGTGYSSLAYLTQLPLNQLKIDRTFVRNLGTKSTDAIIVQTIIGMSNSLGIEVIAEGVETAAQLSFLKQAGCGAYQGYLFSKALPLEAFEDLLRRGKFPQASIAMQRKIAT